MDSYRQVSTFATLPSTALETRSSALDSRSTNSCTIGSRGQAQRSGFQQPLLDKRWLGSPSARWQKRSLAVTPPCKEADAGPSWSTYPKLQAFNTTRPGYAGPGEDVLLLTKEILPGPSYILNPTKKDNNQRLYNQEAFAQILRDLQADKVDEAVFKLRACIDTFPSLCPNPKLYTTLIRGFMVAKRVEAAETLWKLITEHEAPSVYHYSAMIAGYAENGRIGDAIKLLRSVPEPNSYCYTAILKALCQSGGAGGVDRAVVIVEEMHARGVLAMPVTYGALIQAILTRGTPNDLSVAQKLIRDMRERGIATTVQVTGSLLSYYIRQSMVNEAVGLLTDPNFPLDSVCYNIVISGLIERGLLELADNVYFSMKHEPVTDFWSAVLVAATKMGQEAVWQLRMKERGGKVNVLYYVNRMDIAANAGDWSAVLEQWRIMQEVDGFQPTAEAWGVLIKAYARANMPHKMEETYRKMIDSGVPSDGAKLTIMFKYYGEVGNEENALGVIREHFRNGVRINTSQINSLMQGFIRNRLPDAAMRLYHSMSSYKCRPNLGTYAVLVEGFLQANRRKDALAIVRDMEHFGMFPTKSMVHLLASSCVTNADSSSAQRVLPWKHYLDEDLRRNLEAVAFKVPSTVR
mmetsp:Transcript_40942/g.66400  ORF Transcript_40942/g.66400 Transcript_40942/m.66400 type:complete len:634 (+) Transcript_40942:53-1954(+)|eukprot:CAMPEP_0184351302 /NCGR_PEP_ID=MMETSP1089-20130417/43534_1 /TAXON_ID=38269 ORGANISM="Gloeochaete wittrockiana, Strain SAG46.84" /NCGR_SAMPLE_ID=MMETSP1089 /ASSEMBLY_ACC=CAM_ASM_000445 /LENGTH=633 /DNA_ID=CAMNT_0026684613 /DNA_START=55 /DNA_END=1956 /DNA_ORIENTATION=+